MTTSSCLPEEPVLGPSVMPCSVTFSPAYMARMSWLHRTRLLPTTPPPCTLQAADLPPGLLSPPTTTSTLPRAGPEDCPFVLTNAIPSTLVHEDFQHPSPDSSSLRMEILLRIFKIPHLRSPALLSPTAGLCASKAERFLCFNLLTVCVSLS